MKDLLKEEIGGRVRKVRSRLGLSQQRMATLLDMAKISLNRIERGLNYPSALTLTRLAKQFDVSIDWLLCNRGSMFPAKEKSKNESDEGKSSGLFERDVEELVNLMRRSPLVRYSMMDHFQRFKMENQAFIDKELGKPEETRGDS
jgi:transcriptional regulator with XRE-family HTH domain